MRVSEFEEAAGREVKGTLLIHVEDHKGNKAAKVSIDGQTKEQLIQWMTFLRAKLVPDGCPYVFADEKGGKLQNLSRKVSSVAKWFSSSIPTATSVRKAVATQGGKEGGADKEALALAMSHSTQTADKYYRAYDEATNLQGHGVIAKILNIPIVKKRKFFTKAQTATITEYFKEDIEKATMPSPAALDTFLILHGAAFPDRQRADIYSKVRNVIGR